ncbi:MAG: tetratricopeptide repeat protein [Clostridium sp.]|nr:tetratricopeptide repeat protein [Clostridium sp.]
MEELQILRIKELIAYGQQKTAVEELNKLIEKEPENANWPYLRGRAYWQLGEKGKAMTDFEHALHLDPNSPAKLSLEMAHNVMEFFNPDIFNP